MFLVGIVEKFNELDDVKVSMLTVVSLLILLNIFLGIRILMTGQGVDFMQQEVYVLTAISGGINAMRMFLQHRSKNNGNQTVR